MNSKSSRMTRAKGRLLPATARPLLHQNMIDAVDQVAFVAKRQPHNPGMLDIRPLRVAAAADGCRESHIGAVRHVGVHPVPAVYALDQRLLLRAVPLVLLALRVRTADGNNPQAAEFGKDQ